MPVCQTWRTEVVAGHDPGTYPRRMSDHADSPADMVRLGRDIEKAVLAKGLTYHLENRVLRDGLRTIVFA